MRFKLILALENEEIPIQYRKCIISYFKYALQNYNENYYKKFYNEKDPIIKDYTFSSYFENPIIDPEIIRIKSKEIEINVSTAGYESGIILFNAFNKMKGQKFHLNKNSWTLQNIVLLMEKEISAEEIIIKFQSPLCVRSRENKKDYYYSFEHEKFEEMLKINIKEQLKISNLPEGIEETFKIQAINAKKIIVKFYEQKIETSVGIFKISGDKQLLEYLYKSGIGSRHSAGFGMFQII